MPKLPAIKSKNLVKALKLIGFTEHRQKSTSHLVMKNKDGRRTVIPISNKEIPKGTLLAILKDIQITKEELLEIL